MSLVCVECGTVNPDGGAFCTGCGVSLAFARPSAVVRNPLPEEPGRVSGSTRSSAWGWAGVLLLALAGALAVAGTGWWALERTSAPDASVPVTRVESADTATDTPTEAVDTVTPADSLSPREDIVVADPPPVAAPPLPPPPVAKAQKPKKPRVQALRTDDSEEPAPRARPVGPVGGGPASACYGRSGYFLEACINAQCRQPHYRNHPACRGY
ncbi:MAG: hypothetical protein EOO26_10920 [Comamonadaceae bacterium]|nr:MAG: hypothetical protein EOO26_10920 [Comamonadaceae bacterium]